MTTTDIALLFMLLVLVGVVLLVRILIVLSTLFLKLESRANAMALDLAALKARVDFIENTLFPPNRALQKPKEMMP